MHVKISTFTVNMQGRIQDFEKGGGGGHTPGILKKRGGHICLYDCI